MSSILTTVKSFIEMNTSLTISISFMGLCCLLAAFARILVSRTVNSALIKELLYEAIAAAELCACCFELIIGKYYAFIKQNNPIFQINALIFLSYFLSALILCRFFLLHVFRLVHALFRFAKFCLLLPPWCCYTAYVPLPFHWNVNNSMVTWQLLTILVLRFMGYVFSFWQFCGQWFGVMQRHVHTHTWRICSRERMVHQSDQLYWKHGHNWWAAVVSIVLCKYFGGLNLLRHMKVVHLKAVPLICK